MGDKHLEVMLIEYESLRNQIDNNFNHQIQLFTIIVSALGVIYGVTFASVQARDLFLIIPVIIFPLGLRSQYSTYAVDEVGKYLEELEIKIWNNISKAKYRDWEGWQNHWITNKKERNILIYDVIPKWALFILVPMSISVFYSSMVILKFIQNGHQIIHTNFDPNFHLLLALFYASFIVDSGIYYILYKKIFKSS